MSEPFSIQMSRARVITVAACLVVAGILFFAAGAVAGLLVASSSVNSLVEAQLRATKPVIEPAKKPAVPDPLDSAAATTAVASAETLPFSGLSSVAPASQTPSPAGSSSPQSASAGASPAPATVSPAPASSTAAAPNAAKESASVTPSAAPSAAGEPSSESSYVIPLAIKVCSFTGKASAEAMVAALAAKGYSASLGHSSGADGRIWYVVKLGPYKEWNTASNDAARIAIAENVKPEIGPMR